MTKQQAQARIDALQQQVDDADDAERAAAAAVQAAEVAQATTALVVGHVFGAIAGAVPAPGYAPAATTPATPAFVPLILQQPPVTPTVFQPAVVAPATTPAVHPANPRHWSWMQWLCAIIGALVALVIALNTRDWFASLADVHGFPDWLFRAGWIVAVTAVGFFGGGWLGSNVDARRNNTLPAQPARTP